MKDDTMPEEKRCRQCSHSSAHKHSLLVSLHIKDESTKHGEVKPQHSHCAVVNSRYLICELTFFSFHWRIHQNVKHSTVSFMQVHTVSKCFVLSFFLIQCCWLLCDGYYTSIQSQIRSSWLISFQALKLFQNENQSKIYPSHLIQSLWFQLISQGSWILLTDQKWRKKTCKQNLDRAKMLAHSI